MTRHRRTRRLIKVYTVCNKYKNFYKHGNNKNQPDIPSYGKGPLQRVAAAVSTLHKWVKKKQ